MSVRLVFLGNDAWSVPSLDAIAAEPELDAALVVTNPPRPAGRGADLRPTAVAIAATRLGIPLLETDGVRSAGTVQAIGASRPEVIVVVAYGELLPTDLLDLPPLGAVNLHFSLLPRWRGATPVQHAILHGDATTGVTVMRMDAGLDTGPVLTQLEEPIRADDDAGSLGGRLADLGAMLLVGVLRRLPGGDVPARAQPSTGVTLAPVIPAVGRIVAWSREPAEIVRLVRALAPQPGATTTFRGSPMKVLSAAVADPPGAGAPHGAILEADRRGVLVAVADGAVRLLEVAPAGRRRMPAGDWANGARFEPGERLG
ncbi:MAG TPA: methionyl-tRNA formyltransferase [Actinomycetota bacterium]